VNVCVNGILCRALIDSGAGKHYDYENLIHKYPHLKGVTIKDRDKKPMLPVRVVLGSGDYSRIKAETLPRVGKDMEPTSYPGSYLWERPWLGLVT
jgi:hypothetical protein